MSEALLARHAKDSQTACLSKNLRNEPSSGRKRDSVAKLGEEIKGTAKKDAKSKGTGGKKSTGPRTS